MMNVVEATRVPGLIALAILLGACEIVNTAPDANGNRSLSMIMVDEDFDFSELSGAALLLAEAEIEEHVLRLDVVHRSGCVARDFKMYSTEGIYFSDPPQARMHLIMEASAEDCSELTAEAVRFSLTPFSGYESIHLRIHAYGMEFPFVPMPLYEPGRQLP